MVLTNQNGAVAEEYSYDAWGRRRSPTNWTNYTVAAPSILYRGYTGHEHLDEFALINMNGRIYDPLTGRFLSPDNYVQAPGYTQAFNRYSYCLNNPLKFTDPDGNMAKWLKWTLTTIGTVALTIVTGGAAPFAYMVSTLLFGTIDGISKGLSFSDAMFSAAEQSCTSICVSTLSFTVGLMLTPALGAIWETFSTGKPYGIANLVRKGIGKIPGFAYREYSLGNVVWKGLDLPDDIIPNISMSLYAAATGSWGEKRIPAGHWVENAMITEEMNNFTGHSQTKETSFSPQDLAKYGVFSKEISGASLFFAYANPSDAFGVYSGTNNYSYSTSSIPSNGVGWTGSANVSSNTYTRMAILTSLSKAKVTHNLKGKFYERYSRDYNPSWRKFLFGIEY